MVTPSQQLSNTFHIFRAFSDLQSALFRITSYGRLLFLDALGKRWPATVHPGNH